MAADDDTRSATGLSGDIRSVTEVGGAAKGIGWAVLAVCVLAIIGCLGVWASLTIDAGSIRSVHVSLSANGFGHISTSSSRDLSQHADTSKAGIAVTVTAVIVGILAIVRALGRAALVGAVAALVGGLLVIVIAIDGVHDVHSKADGLHLQEQSSRLAASVSVGWGLWLVLIAGIVLALLGILGVLRRR